MKTPDRITGCTTVRLDTLLSNETIAQLQAITDARKAAGDGWKSWRELATVKAMMLLTDWAAEEAARMSAASGT